MRALIWIDRLTLPSVPAAGAPVRVGAPARICMLLLASVVAIGCDRTQEAPPDAGRPRDAAGDAIVDDGGGEDTGPTPDGGDVDAGDVDGGNDVDSGIVCEDPETGCWACDATTEEHLLEHCTDASCEPFDNVARLPLLEADGSLPPLP